MGYNLKVTDLQAAVGLAQLEKLDSFTAARVRNFARLRAGLEDLQSVLVLPEATPHSEPSWFGFAIGIRPEAPFSRDELIRFLEGRRIGTRLVFAGDLTQQPAYREVEHRVVGPLEVANFVLKRVFWIGVYPGLDDEAVDWVLDVLRGFVISRTESATRRT